MSENPKPYVSGAAQPKLNQANLNRIPIPVPPIEEQARIVTILDKFDALVNDISSGLPAASSSTRTTATGCSRSRRLFFCV